MARLYYPPEIVATAAAGQQKRTDWQNVGEKFVKLIPTEIITLYYSLEGMLNVLSHPGWKYGISWAVFGICLVLTPTYIYFMSIKGKPKKCNIIISTFAFLVWAYFSSGQQLMPNLFDPGLAGIIMIVFSFVINFLPVSR